MRSLGDALLWQISAYGMERRQERLVRMYVKGRSVGLKKIKK